jgi:hypothetical protein
VVGLGAAPETAVTAPRLDTNGTLNVALEKKYPGADEALLRSLGFTTRRGASANISLATFDPATGQTRGIPNGG